MSEPIKVGDLVVVVRATPCCGRDEFVGRMFTVRKLASKTWPCHYCGVKRAATAALVNSHNNWADLWRLKRIPPLSELEGEKRKEEIEA